MARRPRGFKLLTLNTHKGFNSFNRRFVLHELREAVRGQSADVVFLQEVLGSHAAHAVRVPAWPERPQYEFLADSIWQDFAYGRNAVYTEGHHGNALLSKFPIVHYENHDVSVGTHEERGLLHCILRVPGSGLDVHAVCVHLGLREAHRRQQLQQLCELIGTEVPSDAPLLVAGDFNDWWLRANRRLQACGLREAFVECRGHLARSFPVRWPLLKLDRIYYRNARIDNPQVLSATPWSRLSDHAALTAEVHL
ncbi:endonuclease/exonuclease/phosphatase family protein [Solimonas terrae]|uniref:Endonuclease/exonuclease/phosphatase family protein n=1 Tax=Solimonas terrae TaxID=1396819 RepID=A0A6M2BUD5_9GAMM|nr:endonuclease/exonuclease/phosphatase family protein [Solimonas terrae]NGY05865.1 endonuclease/exonuclease/phosphatase family protein [Solimonas terrae]